MGGWVGGEIVGGSGGWDGLEKVGERSCEGDEGEGKGRDVGGGE